MPPPPPPAPPPLPKQSVGASSNQGKSNFAPPPDRNALLSQIRKGAQLKKTETNDKSAPLIEGSRSTSNSAVKRPSDTKSNGPFPVIPPGGLFAQGIPKLRPTLPRAGTQAQGDNSSPSSMVIQSIKSGHSASFLDHHRIGQLGGSRSQPPSPVSKPRMTSGVSSNRTVNSEASETASLPSGNPNFPDDINIKGPAPAPPPASQKPVFKPTGEPPASKPTVRRSASQTNLGQRPRLTRPPPNVKPPPPPKSATAATTTPPVAPPPPPSKPPNILRRQSFGVGENHTSRFIANNKLSVPSNNVGSGTPKPSGGAGPLPPPPPPPRNNSAPNDLNQMVTSSSPSGNHWNKMNIAPPPPPNRAAAVTATTGNRAAPIRPPPPRAPAPPPPPPQHQFNSHPTQAKASLSASMAPPPPARVSSMKQSSDFEERFKFHPAQNLPKPEKFPNTQKTYPSKANHNRQKQNTRRMPPPPPPQSGNNAMDAARGQQSVLHIQLNSGIFSNNFAHS